jgi:hypothetical protein
MGLKMRTEGVEAEKGFVDRVDFKIGGKAAQHLDHTPAHIVVK